MQTHVTPRSLAHTNAVDMLKIQPPGSGPYILGGHSYGGAVAVEIALILESWGHEVGLLLVGGVGTKEIFIK